MDLPDSLWEQITRTAALQQRTTDEVISDALQLAVKPDSPVAAEEIHLPYWNPAGGCRMLIDIDDKDALSRLLDDPPESPSYPGTSRHVT